MTVIEELAILYDSHPRAASATNNGKGPGKITSGNAVNNNTSIKNKNKNMKQQHGRVRSAMVLVLVFLTWRHFIDKELVGTVRRSMQSWDTQSTPSKSTVLLQKGLSVGNNQYSNESQENLISAATALRFPGVQVREFAGDTRFIPDRPSTTSSSYLRNSQTPQGEGNHKERQAALLQFLQRQPLYHQQCQKWAVVTTIYEPSVAVLRMGNELKDWCMVVVADTKTPSTYMADAGWTTSADKKVVFLSVQDQRQLAELVTFVEKTPFQSFARKNIGYLYAIWMGAKVIFDFDDDNLLRTTSNVTNPATTLSGEELLDVFSNLTQTTDQQHDNLLVRQISVVDNFKGRAFNPFPKMGASLSDAWPRGLPISLIKDKTSHGQPGPLMLKEVPKTNVAVIQSTCDHDPDVDAIYRLTRELPFSFDSSKDTAMTLQVPPHLYAPYNAQATVHFPLAFWGLYLPMTVTGRVSDIWRSYIVQRLLKELQEDAALLYSPPLVTQFRNAHDYAGDFAAESHLYLRTEALLEFLDGWTPNTADPLDGTGDNLQARIEDLWMQLYEREYIEEQDVYGIQEWLSALTQGGYVFPAVRNHKQAAPDPSTGGVEARRECARRRLAQWHDPIPTMMNGSNFGALTFQNAAHNLTVARILAEYEVYHPFPHSIDLICRAGGKHNPHELAVLIESIDLYWPKCAGRVVMVLDRGDVAFAHEHIPSWMEVYYSEFPYGMPGRLGNQLFNIYSDQQGRSEFVAIADSDTAFVTPVTPDLIFNLDKIDEDGNAPPYVLVDTKYQKGDWSKGDFYMFQGDSNDWTFMITLPIVFPRAMFPQYRAHVEAIHNNEFETTELWEHFRRTKRLVWMAMSQFCLLGNWMVRHWTDTPFDLRNETDVPAMRYAVHLPYFRGVDFRPGGAKHPPSFLSGGRLQIQEGICELFCSGPTPTLHSSSSQESFPKLETCGSFCPKPVKQPRQAYFKYVQFPYGTLEQQQEVMKAHFHPFTNSLASIARDRNSLTA